MPTEVSSRLQIEEIVRKVAEASHAQSVVLFGSRAKGVDDTQSDVDLALVFEGAEAMIPGVRRAHRVLWPRTCPVDLVPITVAALREGKTLLAREIARTGKVLYGPRAI